MKVGIDGGALSITDDRLKVGVYRVAYNLVKELPVVDVKSNYRVYSFSRGEGGSRNFRKSNVEFIQLPRPGFQKIWQPLELMINPVDTYLGISQSLPYTLYDIKKIGFIYDVGFLDHPEYYRESHFALTIQTAAVVRRARHIVTISQSSADSIRRIYHVPKEKLTVAYLGVEKYFHPTGKKHTRKHPYFLFVGSLKPGKNVPMMLRAFAAFLTQSKETYDFVLVGSDYWLDPGISATINSLGLQSRVEIIGFVDDETLAGYYRGAIAMLTVSLIEGFGLPVVEAMASGCPVIGSTAGAYPEVVGNAGILVDPEDEQAITNAITKMIEDVTLRTRCILNGKTRAKQFTWRAFAKTVHDVMLTHSPRS